MEKTKPECGHKECAEVGENLQSMARTEIILQGPDGKRREMSDIPFSAFLELILQSHGQSQQDDGTPEHKEESAVSSQQLQMNINKILNDSKEVSVFDKTVALFACIAGIFSSLEKDNPDLSEACGAAMLKRGLAMMAEKMAHAVETSETSNTLMEEVKGLGFDGKDFVQA